MRFQVQLTKFGTNLVPDGNFNLLIDRIVDDWGVYHVSSIGHVKIDRNSRRNSDLYYL